MVRPRCSARVALVVVALLISSCGSDPAAEPADASSTSASPTAAASRFSFTTGFGACPGAVEATSVGELSELTNVPLYLPTVEAPTSMTLCDGVPTLAYGEIELQLVQAEWVPSFDTQWAEMVATGQGTWRTLAGHRTFVHEAGTNGSATTMVQGARGDVLIHFTAGESVRPSRVLRLADSLSPEPVD